MWSCTDKQDRQVVQIDRIKVKTAVLRSEMVIWIFTGGLINKPSNFFFLFFLTFFKSNMNN